MASLTTAPLEQPTDERNPPWYQRLGTDYLPFLLLAPAVITLLALTVYPFLYSVYISFFRFKGGRPDTFIGLDNYARLLQDPHFWESIRTLLLYAALSVTLEFVLGTALALFFTGHFPLRGLWRSLMIVPMMLTPVVIGVIWRLMYDPNFGITAYALRSIGLAPIEWLSKGNWAFVAVVLVDVWNWTPFMFLLILAGLESLPVEPFEAARMDGASRFQIFKDHMLPMLAPTMLVALLVRSMDVLRIFDQIFIMTSGGPGSATEVTSLYLYKTAFKFFDMGYAAAGLFVLLILITILSRIYIRFLGTGEEG
jgi:multiple sugar transport system permease protein